MGKRTVIITGDHTGDIGTVISGVTGIVHTGNGNVYSGETVRDDDRDSGSRTFSGDGMTVIEGDNYGGISRRY